MKHLIIILLLLLPYLYKIEYIGTKIVAYSNIQPEYGNRKDIIIYKYVDGKYIQITNFKIKLK